MATWGNNISKSIAEIRDDCVESFDEEYINRTRVDYTEVTGAFTGCKEYFRHREYVKMKREFRRMPAEQLISKAQELQFRVDNGLVNPNGIERVELMQLAIMDSIEDCHLGLDLELVR